MRIWSVNVEDYERPYYNMEAEKSIADTKKAHVVQKTGFADDENDNLEDETLRLIMNP